METLFLICAAFGGTILAVQTVLALFGFGGDEVDVDAPSGDLDFDAPGDSAASTTFFKILSLKAIVAFLTFFGLVGLLGLSLGLGGAIAALLGIVAGIAAVFVVAWMMEALSQLQSSGNYDLRNALGSDGKVALRVPGELKGSGRITVDLGGRRIECEAFTEGPELATGTPIQVIDVRGPRTVTVRAAGR
jgi:hypothetical protein